MEPRRPLCSLAFTFALGIGGDFLFSPPAILYPILAVVALAAFIRLKLVMIPVCSRRNKAAREVAKTGRTTSYTFLLVTMIVFLAGGLSCSYQTGKTDPLESMAVTPYNNPEITRLSGANNFGAEENKGDIKKKEKDRVALTGRVLKVREKEKTTALTVRCEGRKLLVTCFGEDLRPEALVGRRINFSGEVRLPPGQRNPGCFDYRLYLKTQGIRVMIACDPGDIALATEGGRVTDRVGIAFNRLAAIKYSFLARAKTGMSQRTFGLFAGMLFGTKDEMDEADYAMFQENGIAHILSVSGLHVAVVFGFFMMLVGRRRSIPISIAIILFLALYAFFSEFSPPVVRAVLMIAAQIFAKVFHLRYDLLTGISASFLLLLILNPLQLMNAGFQLSYMAVLLLSFGLPLTDRNIGFRDRTSGRKLTMEEAGSRNVVRHRDRLKKGLVHCFLPLLLIQVGMAPFTAFQFNYLSLSSILLNVPAVFLAGLIIPAGILMILQSVAAGVASGRSGEIMDLFFQLSARMVEWMLEALTWITALADRLPLSHFSVPAPPLWTVILFYALLFFIFSETFRLLWKRRKLHQLRIAFIALFLGVLIAALSPASHWDTSDLVFVDVGQGDCLHIRTPDGKNYLIDGGGSANYNVGKKTLRPYLLKNGVRKLDGVFMSHLHRDHYGGIRELSLEIPIDKLYLYDGNRVRPGKVLAETGFSEDDLVYLSRGQRVRLGQNVWLDILYPPAQPEEVYDSLMAEDGDENKSSLLMRLSFKDATVLMTGDLGADGEKEILQEEIPKANILKVGHHGSRTSTSDEFLAAVRPQLAVIQVGNNNFGHPTAEILKKLQAAKIPIYRNDLDGAITINIRGKKLDIDVISTKN